MNMNNLMAQAQKMQKDIEKKQTEINSRQKMFMSIIYPLIQLNHQLII